MKLLGVSKWIAASVALSIVQARPCSALSILPASSKAFSADQRLVFVCVVADSPEQEARRYLERDEPLLRALVRKYGSEESAQKVLSENRRAARRWPQTNQQYPFSRTERCETAHEILTLRSNYPVTGLYANDASNRILWPLEENWDFVSRVIVPNDGKHLIAIEAAGIGSSKESGMVFYQEGKVTRTYTPAQLVDFPFLLPVEAGPTRPWLASFRFDEAKGQLILRTKLGNRFVFDVRSGRIVSSFRTGRWVAVMLILLAIFGIWRARKWRRARANRRHQGEYQSGAPRLQSAPLPEVCHRSSLAAWRRRWVAAMLCTLALAVLGILCWPGGEPAYRGRMLSDWLRRTRSGTSESLAEANAAVREIGTNGLPYLLRMMQSEDANWRRRITRWSRQQPFAFLRIDSPAMENHDLAHRGFIILGPIAEPAIPDLINLLDHPTYAGAAHNKLALIGSGAVMPLTAALTNTSPRVRIHAVYALLGISSDATPAVPHLVAALSDSEHQVRAAAAGALGTIQREAALAVPALERCLTDTNKWVRCAALNALASYGSLARSAVPSLLTALDDDDPEVMTGAAKALRCIDRNAAIQAGVYSPPADVRERVSALLGQARDTNASSGRYEAIQKLEKLAAEPGNVVPVMIELLNDPAPFIRAAAARTLGAYEARAAAAVPSLLQKLADQEKYVREAAGWALMQIDSTAAAEAGLK